MKKRPRWFRFLHSGRGGTLALSSAAVCLLVALLALTYLGPDTSVPVKTRHPIARQQAAPAAPKVALSPVRTLTAPDRELATSPLDDTAPINDPPRTPLASAPTAPQPAVPAATPQAPAPTAVAVAPATPPADPPVSVFSAPAAPAAAAPKPPAAPKPAAAKPPHRPAAKKPTVAKRSNYVAQAPLPAPAQPAPALPDPVGVPTVPQLPQVPGKSLSSSFADMQVPSLPAPSDGTANFTSGYSMPNQAPAAVPASAPANDAPSTAAPVAVSSEPGVTLNGRISTPTYTAGPTQRSVSLVDMGSGRTYRGVLDPNGNFCFSGLRTNTLYYVAGWYQQRQQQSQSQTMNAEGWRMSNGRAADARLSWHQALQPTQNGTFSLQLDQYNADSQYAADIIPAAYLRTPDTSWRRAELQPVDGG